MSVRACVKPFTSTIRIDTPAPNLIYLTASTQTLEPQLPGPYPGGEHTCGEAEHLLQRCLRILRSPRTSRYHSEPRAMPRTERATQQESDGRP